MNIGFLTELFVLCLLIIATLLFRFIRRLCGGERRIIHALNQNYRHLKQLYKRLADSSHPAAEWLLDNFYRIERKVCTVNLELTHTLYRNMSRNAQTPQLLVWARQLCAKNDGKLDNTIITDALPQLTASLTSADVCAAPLMLSIAIIEQIDTVASQAAQQMDDSPEHTAANTQQMANCIRSLSFLDGTPHQAEKDGKKQDESDTHKPSVTLEQLFQAVSPLERILAQDPIYPRMDAASQGYYRAAVEKLARQLKRKEADIAQRALELSQRPAPKKEARKKHIGYYLVESGKPELLRSFGKLPLRLSVVRFCEKHTTLLYLAVILLAVRFVSFNAGYLAYALGYGLWPSCLIGVLSVLPASEIGIKLLNWALLHITDIKFVPRLELKNGIPEEGAAFVIVPALLSRPEQAKEIFKNLEAFHWANPEKHLYFALIGDFPDSLTASGPNDQAVIDTANAEVERLNSLYGNKFFYCNRQRIYNPHNKIYTGWERKRGAIIDFVRMLHGERTTFTVTSCDKASFPSVNYIITLDADTVLPHGCARKLIGGMLHPLNTPVIDATRNRVLTGYGILQPRIVTTLDSANRTPFAQVFAGQGGIDPYSHAVSDIYQDLFGEGSFNGKGIFSVQAFHKLLDHAIPDNRVLSHDLLEGCFMRVGLMSDAILLDNFPHSYQSYMARLHRWTRGDWQLLPYLLPSLRDDRGKKRRSPMNGISRWKIIDNLRRSLIAPTLLPFVLLPFVSPLRGGWAWLLFAVLTLAISLIPLTADMLLAVQPRSSVVKYASRQGSCIGRTLSEAGLLFLFLPYQAYTVLDAVIRTLYRLLISKRNLLQWVTAADADRQASGSLLHFYRRMWSCPLFGILCVGLAVLFQPTALPLAALLFLLWTAAPYIACRISTPYASAPLLSEQDVHYLRTLARQTWSYFEDFITPRDNWLIPDNLQVEPANGLAHRVSPTNIGLQLAACVSAWDFGYLTINRLLDLLEHTITSVRRLPKWNGHLFNWYSTEDLSPLHPRYVSTVDNGNYLCCLITVKQALLMLLDSPLFNNKQIAGLLDTIRLANRDGADIDENGLEALSEHSLTIPALRSQLQALLSQPFRRAGWAARVDRMAAALLNETAQCDGVNVSLQTYCAPRIQTLIEQLDRLIQATDFHSLYDTQCDLFSIGYDVEAGQLSSSHYDLLATEARQTSFIAVARGDVEATHWFRLSRALTMSDGGIAPLSWTGTMFEYLMPTLLLHAPKGSLLYQAEHTAAAAHRAYAARRNKHQPWGVSECAFYQFDHALNYQYKAVGIPSLALRRGLEQETVVAPYASLLALMVNPNSALQNLRQLEAMGASGSHGMYEAVDFTASRLYQGEAFHIIKSYMAHHQGMGFLALNNLLNSNIMQQRFAQEPAVRGARHLLEEAVPIRTPLTAHARTAPARHTPPMAQPKPYREEWPASSEPIPAVHLLSNGRYSILLDRSGRSCDKTTQLNISRFRDDLTGRLYGTFLYLRHNGRWLGACGAPLATPTDVVWESNRAIFTVQSGGLTVQTEVFPASHEQAGIRVVRLQSTQPTTAEIMSYFEVALSEPLSDEAHPAFSNLFVSTDWDAERQLLIAQRRPRGTEQTLYAGHCLLEEADSLSFETDRMRFIGRGNTPATADALSADALSCSAGAVLDPILSLRARVRVNGQRTLTFITLYAHSREELLALCDQFRARPNAIRQGADRFAQILSRHLAITGKQEGLFLRLLTALLHHTPQKQPYADAIRTNRGGQQELWRFGISGDLPIVLYRADKGSEPDGLDELIKGMLYLRLRGFAFDLAICYQDGDYWDKTGSGIQKAIIQNNAQGLVGARGGIAMIKSTSADDEALLFAVARLVLDARHGLDSLSLPAPVLPMPALFPQAGRKLQPASLPLPEKLAYANGYGGFDGNDYVIVLTGRLKTPLPWSNVVANERFGFVSTERGGGYTWAENSRENKLTPWYNDPVSDPPGELLCIRDEQSGALCAPTQAFFPDDGTYLVRYGFGYTVYQHAADGLELTLTQFVPRAQSVKLSLLTLRNCSGQQRNLSVYCGARPVLGALEHFTAPYILTEQTPAGTLIARNTYNSEYAGRIMLLGSTHPIRSFTGSREGFTDGLPALHAPQLNGVLGIGLEPWLALQTGLTLPPDGELSIGFCLGQAMSTEEADAQIQQYQSIEAYHAALDEIKDHWHQLLAAVTVRTPDDALNRMLNGRLLYQTICCRLLARSAFYQSGGAYGYRDQLQDALATVYTAPQLTKQQILRAAAHQFVEGDVQHWWHERPEGMSPTPGSAGDKGIRTRFSDDLLWLPYTACVYAAVTGNADIFAQTVPYLSADPLPDGVDEQYGIPTVADCTENLYQHCLRAIDRSLHTGPHGLPLMGSGDWNDGMNTVGNQGSGESVWLGWFLYDILTRFLPLVEQHGDTARVQRYTRALTELKHHLNTDGWDGSWYRRAYFDDGTPLGTAQSDECRIDSIAQSWAALSGAGDAEKVELALAQLDKQLVDRKLGIVKLLDPPFAAGSLHPGYIKSYVPGVRENGGQYSHAAIWAAIAFARTGQGDKAIEILSMLNPINHSSRRELAEQYKAEPYAIAADIYSAPRNAGQGGWTWYTGASGWFYRAVLEDILGLHKEGTQLTIRPCIPSAWEGFSIRYRFHGTVYDIQMENPSHIQTGKIDLYLDSIPCSSVTLTDDGKTHTVRAVLLPSDDLRKEP